MVSCPSALWLANSLEGVLDKLILCQREALLEREESEVSPVMLYTKQSSSHKCCFLRHYMQDEMKMTENSWFPSEIAELNQVFSPPANHSNFRRRDLQFVMSQIQENNFVVQTSRSL